MKIVFLMQLLLLYGLVPGVWIPNIGKFFIISINTTKLQSNKPLTLKSIFNKLNNSTNETMIICYDPYCPHCEHLLWFLSTLNCSHHMKVIKLSVSNETQYNICEKLLNKYNIDFEGVPTILIFNGTKFSFYLIGFANMTSKQLCGHSICPQGSSYTPTQDVIKGIYCLNRSLISRFI